MYEKRVHIRVPAGIEGSYQPINRLAAPRLGITRDISLGGARFASSERLDPGAKISVSLALPRQGEVVITGLVIWSRIADQGGGQVNYESGLCWEHVEAHAQARLNSFLTDYTSSETPMIVSSLPGGPPISWPRAIALGVGIAIVLGAVANTWLRIYDLSGENQSLKNAIQTYRHLNEQIALRSL